MDAIEFVKQLRRMDKYSGRKYSIFNDAAEDVVAEVEQWSKHGTGGLTMAEYIEREAVITRFKQMRLGEHGLIEKMFADGVCTVIENAPAADVAPVVHAQWIEDESGIIICPECKRGYNLIAKFTNYCPACGAKMDGGDSGEAD